MAKRKTKKMYVVDCYITLCKTVRVEAANKQEAEREARELIYGVARRYKTDEEMIRTLAGIGFQDAEGDEYIVSGEYDRTGDVRYY